MTRAERMKLAKAARWDVWGDTSPYIDKRTPILLRSRHRFYVSAWLAAWWWVNVYRRGYGEAEIRPVLCNAVLVRQNAVCGLSMRHAGDHAPESRHD